jgi:hypothetical protein
LKKKQGELQEKTKSKSEGRRGEERKVKGDRREKIPRYRPSKVSTN